MRTKLNVPFHHIGSFTSGCKPLVGTLLFIKDVDQDRTSDTASKLLNSVLFVSKNNMPSSSWPAHLLRKSTDNRNRLICGLYFVFTQWEFDSWYRFRLSVDFRNRAANPGFGSCRSQPKQSRCRYHFTAIMLIGACFRIEHRCLFSLKFLDGLEWSNLEQHIDYFLFKYHASIDTGGS